MPDFDSTDKDTPQGGTVVSFISRAEDMVRELLSSTTNPAKRLSYIASGAAKLASDTDALGRLSDLAIGGYGLDPDVVQKALAQGVKRVDAQRRQKSRLTEPPRPLMRELPPANPFPVEALGVLGAAAIAIQNRVQSPLAMCCQSVLAVATLAAQGLADIKLPTGQARPLSGFLLTAGGSGSRKTSTDNEAGRPIRQREEEMQEGYQEKRQEYENDFAAWETARAAAMKKGKDRAAMKAALDLVGPKPKPPWQPMLTMEEPTIEGLCKLLSECQPTIGVFTSEGAGFMEGHGMADDAKMRTAAGLCRLWDGGPIKRVRAGGTMVLPDRRISMHLMAQPGVASTWLSDPKLVDQGLLSRVLVTAPDSTAGQRRWKEWTGSADLAAYDRRILSLLRWELLVSEKSGGLVPRAIAMSEGGRKAWIDFYDWCEERSGPGGEYAPILSLANKLAEHVARLAAVLTIVNDVLAGEVTAEAIENGAELARHYAAEALRLAQGGAGDPDMQAAQQLLAWLKSREETMFCAVQVYRQGPGSIREKAKAMKIVSILADHGYVERVPAGAEIDGKFRRDVWRLVAEDE